MKCWRCGNIRIRRMRLRQRDSFIRISPREILISGHGELIGELYVFRKIEGDPDFADGITIAYLCAFRIRKDFRGQGLGTRLIETVLADLKAGGFRRATIGVGPDEERNVKLYRRLGFTTKVKDCRTDPCAMNEHMQPVQEEDTWWLLSKELT